MLLKIIILLLVCSACGPGPEVAKKEAKIIPVIAKYPIVEDVPLYVESIGVLYPAMQGEIHAQVDGELEEILVFEGQLVRPGTELLKIHDANYALKVSESEAKVASNQAEMELSQKKLERYRRLREKDLIAQNEWDVHETESEKAKASLQISKTALEAAGLELQRCTLCAPIEGRVGKIDLHKGMWISKNSPSLMSVVKLNPLLVEFKVTEKEFLALSKDKKIELELLSSHDLKKEAVITFLDNQFDPKTGLILVRGTLSNPKNELRPGQAFRVKVPIGSLPSQILIPQKAIRYNDQGPYVYVVLPDETASLKQVRIGQEVGKMVVVTEGLEPEDKVITEGHLRLSRGAKVRVEEF